MRKIDLLFAEYAESHQNHQQNDPLDLRTAYFFQYFGADFPYSVAAFLCAILRMHQCCEHYSRSIALLYYFSLSWRTGLIMVFIILFLEHLVYYVNIHAQQKSWMVFVGIFVLAWIGQFYGHKIEGKKPSFLKDLQFLLIGPIWLLHFVLKKAGLKY